MRLEYLFIVLLCVPLVYGMSLQEFADLSQQQIYTHFNQSFYGVSQNNNFIVVHFVAYNFYIYNFSVFDRRDFISTYINKTQLRNCFNQFNDNACLNYFLTNQSFNYSVTNQLANSLYKNYIKTVRLQFRVAQFLNFSLNNSDLEYIRGRLS